jgi:hypothetical protein
MTCSAGQEKKTTDIKKVCSVLFKPKHPNIDKLCLALSIDKSKENISLFERFNYNIAKIKEFLSNFLETEGTGTYYDKNIYDIIDQIFINRDKDIEDMDIVLSKDPSLISFILYDNYKMFFDSKYNCPGHMSNIVSPITGYFKDCIILEDFAFNNSIHHLLDLSNLVRCYSIRHFQKQLEPKDAKKKKDVSIQYTQINSRAAQHFNVKKKQNMLFNMNQGNIEMFATVNYIKGKKPDLKTGVGAVASAFIFNICKSEKKTKA